MAHRDHCLIWSDVAGRPVSVVSQVLIDLSNTTQLDNVPRWLPLKEQSESIEHSRVYATQGPSGPGSGQGHAQGHGYVSSLGPGQSFGPGQAPGQGDGSQDSPKNSVIKSRSHGIFPDPAKGIIMFHINSLPVLNHDASFSAGFQFSKSHNVVSLSP